MRRRAVDPGGGHEVDRILNAVGNVAVALGIVGIGEPQGPGMHTVHVGKTAGREGADKVQRARRLGVGLQHLLGIGGPCGRREVEIVDDVATVGRQFDAILDFRRGRARLGELPRHPADLDDRNLGAVGQHHGHLQHHLERVADLIGVERGKAFGAIAALQQERLALGRGGQFALQAPGLAGKDQRRIRRQPCFHRAKRLGVKIVGHLHPRQFPPVALCPVAHRSHPVAIERGAVINPARRLENRQMATSDVANCTRARFL